MITEHDGHEPEIDPQAWIASNAMVCGNVKIGPGCRVMYGAQIIAEGGRVEIGQQCMVYENAVLRSTQRHSLNIGDHCVIGPNTHVVGCTIEDEVFVATGASVFHQAILGKGSEVRINAVVHIKTHSPAGEMVPIGWVAVGEPVNILPPVKHDEIWQHQQPLDFPKTVYGLTREEASMQAITTVITQDLSTEVNSNE